MKVYKSLISNIAAGILFFAVPASSARHIRRHAAVGGGMESDTNHEVTNTKDRSLLDNLLDDMSMSMPMPQAFIEQNNDDSDTLVMSEEEVEALLEAASNQGYNIDKSPPWKFWYHSVRKTYSRMIITGTMRFANCSLR